MNTHKHAHHFPVKVQIPHCNQRQLTQHLGIALFALAMLLLPGDAFAQAASDAWVKPGVNIIEALRSGVVTAGALVVGLGVMIVGVWACATLRMEWSKLGYVLIGGVLIMAGPTMVASLLELAKA